MQSEQYMRRCLELAELGKSKAAPNPMVGALLVYKDRIIGEGWHKEYGRAHAEVNCIESVQVEDKKLISESTMYVSLEPCAHYGKTPPCANRLVEEGIKHVVICNKDPFDKVSGRGIQILEDAGIKVETGVLEQEGAWLNRRFFSFHKHKRPYIILKWAQTTNNLFAPLNRTRYQLSNEHSKQLVHKWRTEEAAIMVGYTTALHDDPQLTARLWEGKQPLRIALDKELKLPAMLRIFDATADTWIVNAKQTGIENNISYIQSKFGADVLQELMSKLYQAGKTSLIVEGGVQLLNSFIEQGLWDEARVFTADVDMQEGLAAPILKNEQKILSVDMKGDELNAYLNKDSSYPYVAGMEL